MNITLTKDKYCPKCHKLDIEDPETRAEIMLCNRLADLEFIRCDCNPAFNIAERERLKGLIDCPCSDTFVTPNGTYVNKMTGELL